MLVYAELAGDNALDQARAAMIVECAEDAAKPLTSLWPKKDDAERVTGANCRHDLSFKFSLI